ncbi:ATP-grasp domain-containing protein [Candidatus Protofrankia californiensis]|uniref:ATP-grasp domain-containing protein n=1 Tax=Candidatus Protofrankia californiensis TaxID=1839754 RepID=UPI001F49F09E|nr:ATP-grasp domain-containing protein [Candidatus Protofrankia californiensis]
MPCVLLLEAAGPESGALVATAVASGYEVHAVTQSETHAAYRADLRNLLTGCLLTDFACPAQALHDVVTYAHRIGADAVLTTNEYLTPLLAKVCASLGLPGNDPAHADAARNKAAMHEAFARHGVTAPRTFVVDDKNQLRRLHTTERIIFPYVIKPAEGAGSAGVTVVHDPAGVAAAWQAARTPRGMYGMPLDPCVIVQDYVEGTEYSVESLTQNGSTTHLCATRKAVTAGNHRVEVGHSLPAVLPPYVERAIHQEVERAIAAVGIHNGASHTEVMLTPDSGCVVIEIGARLGAGQIGFLIQHALGIDPWKALLDTALGYPTDLTPTRDDYATVRFLTSPRTGRLASVAGLPTTGPGVPVVHLRTAIGDAVREAQANHGRLGHLVVTGPDADTVDRHAEFLLAQITIDVVPEPAAPNSLDRPKLRPSQAGAQESL